MTANSSPVRSLNNCSNEGLTFSELVLQLCVAYGLGCRAHLSQHLLQTPHAADDASCTHKQC